MSMLTWYDIDVKGKLFDTMLAHYLLQPDQRHNMDFLSETYLRYKPVPIEALIGKKGLKQVNMRASIWSRSRNMLLKMLMLLCSSDSCSNQCLPQLIHWNFLKRLKCLWSRYLLLWKQKELNLIHQPFMIIPQNFYRRLNVLEAGIFEDAGTTFNIASPKQLGEILFDKLKIIDNPKQTATKQYSTGEDILVKLINKHPIVQKILDYRSLTKLKSTYVDVLPTLVSARDGRIHTSYNQAVAATGRLSSNNPNLQNIPIRTERGREIRKAFVPRNENYLLLSADYSQVELTDHCPSEQR